MFRSTAKISLGFTLVELIVMILIIGVLAVGFYAFPGLIFNVEGAAQQFASDLRYAQNLAMSQSAVFYIQLDSSTTYSIRNASAVAQTLPATGQTTATLQGSTTISPFPPTAFSGNVIVFNKRGQPYTDVSTGTALATVGTVCFSLSGNSKCVAITPTTGFVSVQ